jgi:hypothetical protein
MENERRMEAETCITPAKKNSIVSALSSSPALHQASSASVSFVHPWGKVLVFVSQFYYFRNKQGNMSR